MIVGTGIDIIEIARIARSIERYGDHFLRRIYTPARSPTASASGATRPRASPRALRQKRLQPRRSAQASASG